MKDFLKKATAVLLCVGMAGTLAACGGTADSKQGGKESSEKTDTVIRVGSKDFTEGLLVSEIYALALEDAGYEIDRVFDIAGSVVHTALINDEIDLYPEYTGTGLMSVLGMDM
ncbi:MAG: glycine betaine ABC transporter substrate-binding protein, partial [Evtepia sp.]|nr:glycine betaine ABC transporter substrate-binding protein [Evtepia sp.]